MRRFFALLLISVFMVFGVCACAGEESAETTVPIATGVSDGQYEQPAIYYHENLYVYANQGVMTSLADRYVLIGAIEEVDLNSMPSQDFYATGVDLKSGQKVYAESEDSPSVMFVDIGDEYMPLYAQE